MYQGHDIHHNDTEQNIPHYDSQHIVYTVTLSKTVMTYINFHGHDGKKLVQSHSVKLYVLMSLKHPIVNKIADAEAD